LHQVTAVPLSTMIDAHYRPVPDSPGVVRSAVRASFHAVGGLHVLRMLSRSCTRILMYHRFPPADRESFRQQCRHLARNYAVVSLTQVADCLRSGRALPANGIVITVDDGYRDFYQVGWPVLREFGLKATVFLVSDFLEGRRWLWGDRIDYAVKHTKLREALVPEPSGSGTPIRLGSPQEKWASIWKLKALAKQAPLRAAEELVKNLPAQLGVTMPESIPDEYAPLRLGDIRAMALGGIEFGAHTSTHPILPRVEDLQRLDQEIGGCRRRLEQLLELPVNHFCYPNGDWDERSLQLVRESRFKSAVTTELGLNRAGSDPFLLRRIGVEPALSTATFRHYTAGSVANVLGRV
jgi:peptidoglycan/xylan/chitin deacetylase (PgdA/CDA1 family)